MSFTLCNVLPHEMPEHDARPKFYHSPPVVERVASVYAEVTEECFEDRFDDWRALVEMDYPVYEPLKEWLILVEEKDDIPLLDTAHPELRITQRFSKKPSRERFDWSIRCPAGQFTMNMHSKPGEGQNRRYHHLRDEYEKWLPIWMEHFGIKEFKKLNLHYVNVLSHETVPDFFSPDGGLLLNKLLTMFSSVPGEHECIIQPYECRVAVKLQGREESSFLIEVASMPSHGHDVAVKVDFVVQTPLSAAESDSRSVLALLDWEHDHIVRRFEAVFTSEARASFKPES
jgi:hypothetical protein